MNRCTAWTGLLLVAGATLSGCGKPSASTKKADGEHQSNSTTTTSKSASDADKKPKREFKPIEISSSGSSGTTSAADSGERVENARLALKPLQILIGGWNGTSRNASIDEPNWAWDLKTDPKQPALKVTSEKGNFVRDGRLTFFPATQHYEFTATDANAVKRVYKGNFSEEVQDYPGEDKKMQRKYKLELTEPEPSPEGEQWRIVINQQENNRYMLELYRKRGNGSFTRIETVNTQRKGTSFALSDTDYGEKTCVVSQGLGTTAVTYKGKTYWVCCSGCKSAFEDEPEKWVAKFEALNKDKMSKQ